MIPSMFGSKKADRSPVFTEDDIRKLILSFPPPEPRPGRESLVRSLSGRNLVRSDAVIKRFHALLQSATGPIFLNSLHNELGVHDIQWILAQEDEHIYYNRDRRRLLPEGTQKTVYQGIKSELATGGMDLDRVAAEKDITLATLRRILAAQDASLALEDLDNGKTYDSKYLERVKAEILKTIRDTQTAVTLNNTFPQVPITWLESTARDILSQDGNEAQGIVESVSGGLRFTPQSLLVQHKSELQQAQDAYIQHAVKELTETGYCEVTANSRPQILQKASDADLTQAILKQFAQKDSTSKVLELSTKDSSFLIREKELSEQLSLLAAKAADAASEQWPSRRPGEDVTFDPNKLFDANSSSLDQAILESGDPDNKTRTSFETKIVQLQQDTTESFAKTKSNLVSHTPKPSSTLQNTPATPLQTAKPQQPRPHPQTPTQAPQIWTPTPTPSTTGHYTNSAPPCPIQPGPCPTKPPTPLPQPHPLSYLLCTLQTPHCTICLD
ncbi:hypothetical protein D6C95_00341 [Aureobasidium pullulans]|nr:hypothetical protein D6C95_00341 [Aureobasidium pullulans]